MLVVTTRVVLSLLDDRPKAGIVVAALLLFGLIGVGCIVVTWMARDVK